ncbi:MAG TPA: regulatory iron-sulfur-containing complex subunit RicT [Gemmatimonadaceae bacterium]|nr:regulatory iron-sulfur-containing complex subunit RicT [Gemmatimonadaceae bacterium]
MTHLVEVAFKGNRKEFFLWDGDEPPKVHAPVIVEADRGEDLGRVHSIGELAAKRCGGCAHGCGGELPQRRMLRPATVDDERRAAELRAQDEDARRRAMERVRAHALVMKVSDAEWQWDRKKLTFYFTAEKRVDVRALVRDLASAFRTRIELKQIGVRDEAKRLSGIGRCAREYCSASWLPELRPVNLQVAKDQRLSLNPSQISGACGRLMCCLRYEHEFYVQSRKRFPKEGKILVTARGEEKVVANDIFNDRVTLRSVEGDVRVVPLAELKAELEQRAPLVDEPRDDEPPAPSAGQADTGDELPLDEERARPALRAARPPRRERGQESAPAPAPEPAADGDPAVPADAAEPRDRRPHRRRGRRGGRRNRPG